LLANNAFGALCRHQRGTESIGHRRLDVGLQEAKSRMHSLSGVAALGC
jgi:hypothetical protein